MPTFDASGQLRVLPYTRQVSARTAARHRGHLSKAAVAFHAAKSVYHFMHQQPTPVMLALGADVRHARYDQLIILGLQQRSRGTYEILLNCESVYVLERGAGVTSNH